MRWLPKWRAEQTGVRPEQLAEEPPQAESTGAPADAEVVRALAVEHLEEPYRQRWLDLLRPAVQLVPLVGANEPIVSFGGRPSLPDGQDWPEWPGHGPLSFIAEVMCDRLSAFELDIQVPTEGRLLFFYFDGSYDDGTSVVGTWDVSSLQGARIIHVPIEARCSVRTTPDGITTYPERQYEGRAIVTYPGWEHPDLEAEFREPDQDRRAWMDHPVNGDAFSEALHERHTMPLHQIGGYADPVQGPVEAEVASAALGTDVPWGDPRLDQEALLWELLLQVDTDDDLGMMWGDCGVLYWMTRADESMLFDGATLGTTSFTWQCG